jgi:hypothetical protein
MRHVARVDTRNGYQRIVAAVCRDEGWPEPEAEYRFAPPRRWRFDLAWQGHGLAVEIQGGLFTAGRHVRGAALLAEFDKVNTAAILGWVVLFVSPPQVTDGSLREWLRRYFTTRCPSTPSHGDTTWRTARLLAVEDPIDPVIPRKAGR